MELSVTEQRYRAVLDVRAGSTVMEVVDRFGDSRQGAPVVVVVWAKGLNELADRSRGPRSHPVQVSAA